MHICYKQFLVLIQWIQLQLTLKFQITVAALTGDIKGLKIAVPKEYLGEGVGEEARNSVLDALKVLEKLGAAWEEVSLPHSKYALATYYLLLHLKHLLTYLVLMVFVMDIVQKMLKNLIEIV